MVVKDDKDNPYRFLTCWKYMEETTPWKTCFTAGVIHLSPNNSVYLHMPCDGCVIKLDHDATFFGVMKLSNTRVIPWTTFGNLSQMNLFKLTGNPFNCDCDQGKELCDCTGNIFQCTCNMQWLQEQVQKYPTLSWDVTCENPAKVRGKSIEEIKFIPHGCETKYHRIVGGTVGGVLALVVLIAAVVLCRKKLRRCLDKCRQGRKQDELNSNIETEPLADGDSLSRMSDEEEARNGEDVLGGPGPVEIGDVEVLPENDPREPYHEDNEQPFEVPGPEERDQTQPKVYPDQENNVNPEHRSVSERLPPEIANMVVTEQQLNKLAMNLGNEWENLAIDLGLKRAEVETIKDDNIGKANVSKLKMLLAWKAKQKTKATIWNLVKELEAFGAGAIDEDKYDFFLETSEATPQKHEETSGPWNYNNEERSAPARGVVHPDRTATFQVNGVKVHFPELSVEEIRTISVEVEHPVVRNQRQRDILQDGVCGPLITVVQSSDERFQTPVTVTVDLQYPAGSKQSEPNEDQRWHLFRQTGTKAWEDVADFNPQVTDTTIEYKTSEFCRHWLVKLTEDAVLSFMQRMNDFIEDYINPLVVLVMYPGQNGAVVFDCLNKADPSLKHLVLKSGYNQRCVPMDQTEEVKARLEGNIQFTGGNSMTDEITFQHPKSARGDLNKKEVFLALRDSADPNHLGYITYSIAQREVTKMPISVTTQNPEDPSNTGPQRYDNEDIPQETQAFLRLIASKLKINLFPFADKEAETQRLKKISEWKANFTSDQTYSRSSEAYTLINDRKNAVCRIEWPNNGRGTGFLIGKKEILTCDHVYQGMLNQSIAISDTARYKAIFDLHDDSDHTFYFSNIPPLSRDPDSGLDYAILELDSEPNPGLIPPLGGCISDITESTRFVEVIGHPFGGPKRVDSAHMVHVDRNSAIHVMFGKPDTVSYQTYLMLEGSSGSPGFNTDGNVILLHNRGIRPYLNGPSVIEQGTKLTSIVEHARSNLPGEKFAELFPTISSDLLFGGGGGAFEAEELH
ncbi:uncharacterized protein LOC118405955 [Branchiostoma floridae]|uniref:Uncharacterized protein LOC118405955 n=1 Tax=Branchiostoma floridae TaxID=7739 RepID=A0A9J7K951_BRAFL|nr:uncharacterized protein LOC118405955 [Branchiostoma floridae]